jgi:Flp pilus assembly pilin Flp
MDNKDCDTRYQALAKRKERGASLVEYSLLVALISVVAITAVKALSVRIEATLFSTAGRLGGAGDVDDG